MAEARTVRTAPRGEVSGEWQERFGTQHLTVSVYSSAATEREINVCLERRWGPQLGDRRTEAISLNRAGAVELRDALTAALEWRAED